MGAQHRYELLDVIGHGASGVVHLARDRTSRSFVAAKVLQRHGFDDLAQQRFLSEQRLAVADEHVLTNLDWFQTPSDAVLVMELADAGSLEDVLALNHTLSRGFVESVASQLAAGLAALHEAGVIHRDIKPANVMLCTDTAGITAKLGDLGTALASGRTRLTQDASVIGTVGFVAPEVLAGSHHDELSDLWSLGTTLSQLIERNVDGISPVLSALVARLTAADRTTRPQSARSLVDALPPPAPLPLDAAPTMRADVERAMTRRRRRHRQRAMSRAVVGAAICGLLVAASAVVVPESATRESDSRKPGAVTPQITTTTAPAMDYLLFRTGGEPTQPVAPMPNLQVFVRREASPRLMISIAPSSAPQYWNMDPPIDSRGMLFRPKAGTGAPVGVFFVKDPSVTYWVLFVSQAGTPSVTPSPEAAQAFASDFLEHVDFDGGGDLGARALRPVSRFPELVTGVGDDAVRRPIDGHCRGLPRQLDRCARPRWSGREGTRHDRRAG